MGGDELFELDDGALVTAQLELDVEPFLDRRKTRLGEPGDCSGCEVLVGEVGQGVAAPQGVRLSQQVDRSVEITGCGPLPPLSGASFEPLNVDGIQRQLQGVAVAPHDHEIGRAQRTAKLGGEPLQPVPHRRRRVVTPQCVHQVLSGDHTADVQCQDREERSQLRPRHRDVASLVIEHFEFTEQPDAHGATVSRPLAGLSARSAWRQP